MKHSKLMFMLVGLLSFSACSYEHFKGTSPTTSFGKAGDCGPVDFATVNTLVFKKSCTGCHSPNSGEEVKGIFFNEGFLQVKSQLDISVKAVLSGRMPKGGRLTQNQLDILLAWQQQKAPETTTETAVQSCQPATVDPVTPNPVDPAPVTPDPIETGALEANYDSIRKNIFEVRCAGCHGFNAKPGGKPAKHQFDTYAEIIQYKDLFTPADENSKFAQALITGDMPMFDTPLEDNEIAIIVEWIKAGLPETQGGPPALLPETVINELPN